MGSAFFGWIQERVRAGRYVISKHAELERSEENIDVIEIEKGVASGLLLEDYPADPRGHSCLIAGFSGGRWIHLVCGQKNDWAIIITVYVPLAPYWRTPIHRGES